MLPFSVYQKLLFMKLMELAGDDGSRTPLDPTSTTVFGRGSGISTADRTISRRHVSFWLINNREARVGFEVIGKNPIWVRSTEGGEVRVFRRREKGEVAAGDWVCFGGGQRQSPPVWFVLKRSEFEEEEEEEEEGEEESETSGFGGEVEGFDVSSVDPVKEFGFLVIGHEFDHYPKQRIRDIKNWDWFLEEPIKDSDEDNEVSDKRKMSGRRRKRGKTEGNDDDDWTGEGEEDKELIAKARKVQRPKYFTRSNNHDKPQKGTKHIRSLAQKNAVPATGEEIQDEEDPTLGGFIVDDESDEVEAETDADEEDEEEEEEFNDDYDDDDD